ncbi:hypothetical protein D4Q52_19770 [Rhodopseudomonas palustris]|uniref:Uncharacterized protein n=1 Tax=Rhodopseudomonas palustris TaxID=1076 RepID=A0A418V177_RHOPL|nr:hypothetical protein D4Q52_19770 [Rhodopseudomonas palustris]
MLAEETAHLGSDEAYLSWTRKKRVAEQDARHADELVASLEVEVEAARRAEERSAFTARFAAAAAQNEKVVELYRTVLPRAWEMIADVLRQAALAQIETDAVLRAMPADFEPDQWIGDPDRTVRCRPAISEATISEEVVDLWVDRETGGVFADQETPPRSRTAHKRPFRRIAYQPFRPASDAAPFFRDLIFPRLGNTGGHLFDGRELRSARDVLAELAKPMVLEEITLRPLTKIEPI